MSVCVCCLCVCGLFEKIKRRHEVVGFLQCLDLGACLWFV